MKFLHIFIDRPVLAAVISVLVTLIGAVAYPTLPAAQYPEIAPPTVVVSATYGGASAETLAETVATPIEEQINGVENMIYMSSQSTGDGKLAITCTFKLGTDLNQAQVLVQNRVSTALPRLPAEVQSTGVTVRKSTPDLLLAVHFFSPDKSLSQQYIANYVTLNVRDEILRLQGVGDVFIRGQRDYAIRVWIDPDKAAARNLTVEDITSALRSHNVQVAAGALGAPPFNGGGVAYQLNIQALGRLTDPSQFADIIVKRDAQQRITRVGDVARVELGAQDYTTNAYIDRSDAALLAVLQLPGSNALKTDQEVKDVMKRLSAKFPPGLSYVIRYDPTDFIRDSITEVQKTLFEALILVVIVVLVFLQSWRAAVIPIIAIPVSLVGTFAMMKAAGFSLNTLSLFGLVLAIGIVVDDAIVVVENVERHLEEGLTPREAAHATMDEVGGALIAIAMVLVGVFVPSAFIAGISGQFYRQFALTIATATMISLLVSLTLSPALAALIMRPKDHKKRAKGWRRPFLHAANAFNKAFDRLSHGYSRLTGRLLRVAALMLVAYAGLLVLTGWRLAATPTGFIPAQDQGTLIIAAQLPPGSSLQRTDALARDIIKRVLDAPGIAHMSTTVGVDPTSNTTATNAIQIFLILKPFGQRLHDHLSFAAIQDAVRKRVAPISSAQVRVIQPPPVRGIGTTGGFKMILEDRGSHGYDALAKLASETAEAANGQAAVRNAFTTFNTKTPRLFADIDREKAEVLGVPDSAVFDTLQTYLGSSYINDFNYLGHTFEVLAQADWPYRRDESAFSNLQTRSNSGAMAPMGAFVTLKHTTGPYRVLRYNLYPGAEVQGDPAPGASSGQALKDMQKVVGQLPDGFGYDWTELAYQQTTTGDTAFIVFGMAVVFAFLLLAALYESVTLPLAVIFIVPMCLLAAMIGVGLRGLDNNILTQIGLVVLIGLAAKNAILIVEFARQGEEEHGLERRKAAAEAARTRLRPILMTSFAFIFGVIPLAFAKGAGAEVRQAIGVAVFFGMIGVTIFGLLFTPTFYVVFRGLADRLPKPAPTPPGAPTTGGAPAGAQIKAAE